MNNQKKKSYIWIVAGILILCVLVWLMSSNFRLEDEDVVSVEGVPISLEVGENSLDDGRLKLVNVLEYDGPNFESEGQEFGSYTMFEFQNVSDQFLRNAKIEMSVNGTDRVLLDIVDVPAGKSVMAIGKGYDTFHSDDLFGIVSCESVFEEAPVIPEGLVVSVENGLLHITNQSSLDLSGKTIVYKACLLDGQTLFGQNVYEWKMEDFPIGSMVEIEFTNLMADSIEIVDIK